MTIQATPLFSAVSSTGAQSTVDWMPRGKKNFVAYGTTTSASGTATIRVEGSTGAGEWVSVGEITIALSATIDATQPDGFAVEANFPLWRGKVTAIAGTGASVNLTVAL